MAPITNTKENGFEKLIVDYLVAHNGFEQGSNEDYSKEYAIDEVRLFRFRKLPSKRNSMHCTLRSHSLKEKNSSKNYARNWALQSKVREVL